MFLCVSALPVAVPFTSPNYVHLLSIFAQMLCSVNVYVHAHMCICNLLASPVQRFCRDRISRCKPCSSVSCSCRRNMMLLSTLSTCLASVLLSITRCGRFTAKKEKKSKSVMEKQFASSFLNEHTGATWRSVFWFDPEFGLLSVWSFCASSTNFCMALI